MSIEKVSPAEVANPQAGSLNIEWKGRRIVIREVYLMVIILLIGMGLRFYKLEFQGLWYDEIHSMNESDPDLTIAQVIDYAKTDQPPSFFLMLHTWFKVFPFNDFYGRLFAAVLGVLGVISMYFLGKEVRDSRTGVIAAFLASINYFHLYYSQEVRFYILFFVVTTLSYLFFLRGIRTKELKDFVWYGIVTAITMYTHYFGVVVFASQAILFLFILALYGFDKKLFLRGLIVGICLGIIMLPWVPQMLSDSELSFWVQPVPFPEFMFAYFYNYFEDKVVTYLFAALFVFHIVLVVLKARKEQKLPSHIFLVLIGWMVLGYGIPLVYSWLVAPMLIVRYTIFILPAVLMMVAVGIASIEKKKFVIAILLVATFFQLRSIFVIKDYYTKVRKQQWREVVKTIVREQSEPSVIFSYYSWHYNYYFKSLHTGKHSTYPLDVNYADELRKVNYVWLIQGHEGGLGARKEDLDLIYKDFDVYKKFEYYQAGAVLFKRKGT